MTMLPRAYPLPTPTAPAVFSRVGNALVVGISLHILSFMLWACTFWGIPPAGRQRPFSPRSTFIME